MTPSERLCSTKSYLSYLIFSRLNQIHGIGTRSIYKQIWYLYHEEINSLNALFANGRQQFHRNLRAAEQAGRGL